MAAFQFKDYRRKLDIAGHEFTVVCDSDMSDKVAAYGPSFTALSKQYKSGEKTKQDCVDFIHEAIDAILGDGAFDTIFSKHDATLTNASDVLIYLCSEITSVIRQTSMNRGQRRAAENK